MKSIKNKIIVFSILATLIPSLGLGILSFQQNEAMISENVSRELRALANYASRELDLWIKEQIYVARELSTSKILIDGLSQTDSTKKNNPVTQQQALGQYLASVHKKLDTVLELAVVDTEGVTIASSVESPSPVTLPQDWLQNATTQGNVTVPPHWNAHYTAATLTVSVPILSMDDFILGALIVTVDLRSIRSGLKDTIKSPPGEVLLLDIDGNVMLASHIEITNTTNAAPFDPEVLKRLQDNQGKYQIFHGLSQEKVIGLAYKSGKLPITVVANRNYSSTYVTWEQQRNLFISLVSIIILIVTAIALRLGHSIVVPLQRLIDATHRIVKGDFEVELVTAQSDEIGQLTQTFNQMTDKLRQNQIEILAASDAMLQKNQLLETLSITDNLTGLYNRNKLNLIISDQLARFERNRRPFAILMIDVDYFKTLNDNLGHIAGDEILSAVAKKLAHCIRNVDYAARYGGDEFIIILTESVIDEALKTAERIRSQVANIYCTTINKIVHVTLSIGITQSEPEDTSSTILLSRVDSALYEAKHAGRDQAHCIYPRKSIT